VIVDDCIGSATTDVPGVDLTNARGCDISIGVQNPSNIAGSASKQVQTATGVQVTYATLQGTGPVIDGRFNRIAGLAPLTSIVIV
jgi:hypothetical protein